MQLAGQLFGARRSVHFPLPRDLRLDYHYLGRNSVNFCVKYLDINGLGKQMRVMGGLLVAFLL